MSAETDIVESLIEEILVSKVELFHDQYDAAFIAVNNDGSNLIKIGTNDFKQWIAKRCWEQFKHPLSNESVAKVANALGAMARFDGLQHKLSIRMAWDNNCLLYDLGKDQPSVLIASGEWSVLKKSPIIFRRLPHQTAQTWPIKSDNIDLLYKYVNLESEADRLLFTVFTITSFIPEFPHPILILHGQQGAGKSTPMKILKKLIDPSQISGLPTPASNEAFVQQAHHHAFLFFDNLSGMPGWFSDALARASTGDSFSKRVLFTDDDDMFYAIQLPIALNGISQVISKPDLLDRAILLKLERIEQSKRKAESTLWAEFETDKPAIMGAIFEALAGAIEIHPQIDLEELPRMADFARWGCAVAEAIGYTRDEFLEAYSSNRMRQNDEAIYSSSVAQAVIMLMDEEDEWAGAPSDLLTRLNKFAILSNLDRDPFWPKSPVWLTRRLNEVETNLVAKGLSIAHTSVGGKRIIKIEKTDNFTVNTSDTDQPEEDSKSVNTLNL